MNAVVHTQRVWVSWEYPVIFTRGVFRADNAALVRAIARREPLRRHRLFVCVDVGVASAWPTLLDDIRAYAAEHAAAIDLLAEPMIVPGGEAAKNAPELVSRLHQRFFAAGLDRQSVVLAIGGGAVLDLVGYAAGTTHRGIRLVRIPTTVLAQNDAGIGVKNGVNGFGQKNAIGTFQPPFAVLDDTDFLRTLPARDAIAGLSEAVKVAAIKDATFFDWLCERAPALATGDEESLAWSVRRCAELHLDHIASAGDPFEQGSARPLDYGHWAAHKLETASGHALRHGEAVAIGMALDARYAVETGLLEESDCEKLASLLEALGLRLWHDALDARAPDGTFAVLAGLDEFRQHLGGELTLTMLSGIGRACEIREVAVGSMLRALSWLRERAR